MNESLTPPPTHPPTHPLLLQVHFILRHQNPVSGEWEEKHAQGKNHPPTHPPTHLPTP